MKVLVAGAGGLLGRAIVREFAARDDVVALGHDALDIADARAVASRVAAERPQVVINCAAYNRVDAAEDDPAAALAVNAFGVGALARAVAEAGAALVHYSSDFVFDGTASRPYTEADRPNPQSAYAITKLLGEWFAADAPRHYVLRVESLFGALDGGLDRGSAAGIFRRLLAGDEVPVFADRTVSPSFVHDVAAATRALLDRRLAPGLYHCVNSGTCTWVEFAEEAARLLGSSSRLRPITLESVKLRASRPRYCALSSDRLRTDGIVMPDWRDALRRALEH